MKRLLALVPLIIAGLALTSCGPRETTYTASGAFTFTIPAGFTAITQNGEPFPIFVDDPSNYTAYMQIASNDNTGSLQEFVKNEMQGFQGSSELSNIAYPESGTITTENGIKGARILMTFDSAKGHMEMAAYYFQKPGQIEVLHAFCYAQEATHFLPLFDESAASLVLK